MNSLNVGRNISLKPYNTFGINVNAKFFSEVRSEEQLKKILSSHEFHSVKKLIIGGGSNILLTNNFDGIVLKISIPDIEIIFEDENYAFVKAGAGVIWHDLVLYCVERNLGGIENLSLIPGTVGAAPIQNIGAYGQELKDVFENLEGISIENQNKKIFHKNECRFGYRDSIFKQGLKNKFIITTVTLKLSKNPKVNIDYGNVKDELKNSGITSPGIKEVSEIICRIRLNKLPDPAKIGNAGSFFKNPEIMAEKFSSLKKEFPNIIGYSLGDGKVKVPAGWLIENCGWKGKVVGNTGAHAKQALVLVNYGNATGEEILNLSSEIKKSVMEKFKIELNEEVNII
jgi:UDP-N-acetylmuramate dehydrogenase